VLGTGVWMLRPSGGPGRRATHGGNPSIQKGTDTIQTSASAPTPQAGNVGPGAGRTETEQALSAAEDALTPEEEQSQKLMAEAFQQDGWNRVEAPEPDPAILEWRPEALRDPARSEALLTQLRTQDPQSLTELNHAEQIATDLTVDERFRKAAIEALTRSQMPEAQAALLRIVAQKKQSEKERGLALAGIRPTSSEDAAALFLKEWTESRGFPESLREQAASTWVARALLDGQNRAQALSKWKAQDRPRIARIWKALTGDG
jgi:hypothetical protein